jgi:chemotaxis protein CheY-P-specific phosphatase CheC
MLRPIQITPITDQTPIRSTVIPNTMSQEQFMANQMAGNNVQLQQPVSPIEGLIASGQEGLQGAERISKQIAKSPRVQGLLGGGETAQGLLGDIQGNAALTGLFSTLQAIGRPVRRGEDRYLGAVQYGQQAMADAQQRGVQDLSTRMKLEEMMRAREMSDLRRNAIMDSRDRLSGGAMNQMAQEAGETAATPSLQTFTPYQQSQMTPDQARLGKQAEVLSQEADALAFIDKELSDQYRDQAKNLREQATTGIMTRKDAVPLEKNLRDEFTKRYLDPTNEIVQRRNTLSSLIENGGPVSNYLSFVSALKTVEPTSAVLSSEYDAARALSSLTTRLEDTLNMLDPNRPLPEQFKKDLQQVGDLMAEAAMEHYNNGAEQYRGIATRQSLNPDNVLLQPVQLSQVGQNQDEEQQVSGASSVRTIRQRGGVSQ